MTTHNKDSKKAALKSIIDALVLTSVKGKKKTRRARVSVHFTAGKRIEMNNQNCATQHVNFDLFL